MSARDRIRDATPLWLWVRLRGGDDARRRVSPVRPAQRRFQAYGVGVGKTGTTSLAAVFEKHYRAAHSPGAVFLATALERLHAGRLSRRGLLRFLRHRDRMLGLELESNPILGAFTEPLVELYPHARFILTTRDCYTWLESAIGQQLSHRANCTKACAWARYSRSVLGQGPFAYAPEEAVLKELRLPPVDAYFRKWRTHNESVLRTVPPERLLIVPTAELRTRLEEIARFVGADPAALDGTRVHSHARPEKPVSILDAIGPEFLNRRAAPCGDIMARLFPGIGSAEEAFARQRARKTSMAGGSA